MSTKCKELRSIIKSNELEFILEAHNGISAAIVERAGFKAIWGSGFAMSAQFGVRDSNEASWTQVVDMLEFILEAHNGISAAIVERAGFKAIWGS